MKLVAPCALRPGGMVKPPPATFAPPATYRQVPGRNKKRVSVAAISRSASSFYHQPYRCRRNHCHCHVCITSPCDRVATVIPSAERWDAFVYEALRVGSYNQVTGDTAMQNKYAEVTPRYFNPMWAPALSEEARKAVNAAFDAMSTWRIETAKNSEKNSEQVIEKMAAAARALGWPEQVVDTIRAQMQSITKMQIQTMDQMMDAWEEQIKSPNPITGSPSAMLSKLKSLPGVSPAGSWANANALAATNPMQFWMQWVEQWQKAWADAMSLGQSRKAK